MPRADLLALSPDDLAAITNRGIVKRAQRELETAAATFTIDEPADGPLVIAWSDGVSCRFPAGKSIHDAVCSSGALGVTRHIVKSVLAYQTRHAAGENPAPATTPEAPASNAEASSRSPASVGESATAEAAPAAIASDSASGGSSLDAVERTANESSVAPPPASSRRATSWDPGEITDEQLVERFRAAAIAKARQRFQAGVLVELTRGAKPTARFLDEPCLVRFLVPGDLRYLTADCAEPLLAVFVPLAVWAFRELPPDRAAGLVSIQPAALPTPTERLDELDALLLELARDGAAGVSASWSQRAARLEDGLRDAGLIWPAEGVGELLHQRQMYETHDARFDPREVALVVGELLARSRAIRRQTVAAPQLLIRGTRSDKTTEIAGGRLIGLGCGVRAGRRSATLSVYLHDADSGGVSVVERTFVEPAPEPNAPPVATKSFAELATTVIARGASLASLGTSQLLLKSGKRAPSGQLTLPRISAAITTHPQAFAWEHLKPPTAAEGFASLAARLQSLPPSYLRPRRLTENLHVVALERIEDPEFDATTQRLVATARDALGGTALVVQPFHARAQRGFDALAATLERRGGQARFVCGRVRVSSGGLQIEPISLVFDDGARRVCLQPWIATAPALGDAPTNAALDEAAESPLAIEEAIDAQPAGDGDDRSDARAANDDASDGSPLEAYVERVRLALADLLVAGVRRADERTIRDWGELVERGRRLGFVRLVEPPAKLAALLAASRDTVRWDSTAAARATLELCLVSRVAAEAGA